MCRQADIKILVENSIIFCIFPPKINIPPRDIACTSTRVKKPRVGSFKPRGGQAILQRGIATNHHGNVCISSRNNKSSGNFHFCLLSRQKFVIPPGDIACTSPRVKKTLGRYFKRQGGQSLSLARLSIPPKVILTITILDFPANSGGFPQRDFTFLSRNKVILIFPKIL